MTAYRHWSEASREKLRRLYADGTNAELRKALKRSDAAIQNAAVKMGLRKSPEFMAKRCRFQPGRASWNAGTHWKAGGRARLTRFKKGNKPQTWRPVGSERINRDGTLERKVSDTRSKKRDWKPVKDILWETKRGPIPRGMFVVHKNRNRQDFRLRNLTLVDRAENMRRNTYHRYPKEVARLIQLRGALNRQINRRQREEQNRGPSQPSIRGHREGEGRRYAARPRQDHRRSGAGHHQQREGGNRLHQRGRGQARNRLHPGLGGGSGSRSAGAR